jgi:hypothetical protein
MHMHSDQEPLSKCMWMQRQQQIEDVTTEIHVTPPTTMWVPVFQHVVCLH